MARSRKRRHIAVKADRRNGGQPIVRNLSARAAWEQSGAGFHGKTTKAQRRADTVAIQRGDIT